MYLTPYFSLADWVMIAYLFIGDLVLEYTFLKISSTSESSSLRVSVYSVLKKICSYHRHSTPATYRTHVGHGATWNHQIHYHMLTSCHFHSHQKWRRLGCEQSYFLMMSATSLDIWTSVLKLVFFNFFSRGGGQMNVLRMCKNPCLCPSPARKLTGSKTAREAS